MGRDPVDAPNAADAADAKDASEAERRSTDDRREGVTEPEGRKSAAVRKAIRSELAADARQEDAERDEESPQGKRTVAELKHVSLAFDTPILEDVSFEVCDGETM